MAEVRCAGRGGAAMVNCWDFEGMKSGRGSDSRRFWMPPEDEVKGKGVSLWLFVGMLFPMRMGTYCPLPKRRRFASGLRYDSVSLKRGSYGEERRKLIGEVLVVPA